MLRYGTVCHTLPNMSSHAKSIITHAVKDADAESRSVPFFVCSSCKRVYPIEFDGCACVASLACTLNAETRFIIVCMLASSYVYGFFFSSMLEVSLIRVRPVYFVGLSWEPCVRAIVLVIHDVPLCQFSITVWMGKSPSMCVYVSAKVAHRTYAKCANFCFYRVFPVAFVFRDQIVCTSAGAHSAHQRTKVFGGTQGVR